MLEGILQQCPLLGKTLNSSSIVVALLTQIQGQAFSIVSSSPMSRSVQWYKFKFSVTSVTKVDLLYCSLPCGLDYLLKTLVTFARVRRCCTVAQWQPSPSSCLVVCLEIACNLEKLSF